MRNAEDERGSGWPFSAPRGPYRRFRPLKALHYAPGGNWGRKRPRRTTACSSPSTPQHPASIRHPANIRRGGRRAQHNFALYDFALFDFAFIGLCARNAIYTTMPREGVGTLRIVPLPASCLPVACLLPACGLPIACLWPRVLHPSGSAEPAGGPPPGSPRPAWGRRPGGLPAAPAGCGGSRPRPLQRPLGSLRREALSGGGERRPA